MYFSSRAPRGLRALALVLAATLWGMLAQSQAQSQAQAESSAGVPAVVASIAPVHSLVASVMQGVGEPHLILKAAASPHVFALRPSDAAALEHARAVFWIGPDLERFLEGPLATLAGAAETVALGQAAGVERLALREGGVWAGQGAEAGHGHGPDQGPDHGQDHGDGDGPGDPHVWLDPKNARAMVAAIAQTLARVDPAHAAIYHANADAARASLEALDAGVAARLGPLAGRPFLVFHDGFQYFEHRYGLAAIGAVTINPERQPGAERLSQIRSSLAASGAVCIFSEPQFPKSLTDGLLAETGLRAGVLDPIGVGLDPGPALYAALIEANAKAAEACLAP